MKDNIKVKILDQVNLQVWDRVNLQVWDQIMNQASHKVEDRVWWQVRWKVLVNDHVNLQLKRRFWYN